MTRCSYRRWRWPKPTGIVGDLDEGRHKFIMQSMKEMIHERDDSLQDEPAKEGIEDGNLSRPCVLCLPARDEADEIAGMMLAQLLATGECLVQSVPYTVAADDLADLVEKRKPDVVCISATPPAAVMHARHLCKYVRNRFSDVPVVVGLWNAEGDLSKAKTRIGGGGTTHVVVTLAEAREQVRLLIKPLLPPAEKQARPDSVPRLVEEVFQ